MYLYFDKNGVLKEYINDEALRQGNFGVNYLFIYIEGRTVSSIDAAYLMPDKSIVGPKNFTIAVTAQIPFDRKRDLRYFKYYTDYRFIKIALDADINGNSALDQTGVVHASLAANMAGGISLTLGEFNFSVEEDAVLNQHYVATEEYLSLSDYKFLRGLLEDRQAPLYMHNIELSRAGSYRLCLLVAMRRQEAITSLNDLEEITDLLDVRVPCSGLVLHNGHYIPAMAFSWHGEDAPDPLSPLRVFCVDDDLSREWYSFEPETDLNDSVKEIL